MRVLKKVLFAVLSAITALFLTISLLAAGLLTADLVCEAYARTLPSYQKIDLTPLLEREHWTEDDYAVLYRQTGLSKLGADSVPREQIPLFQDAFFLQGEVRHEGAAITTWHDILTKDGKPFCAPIAAMEDGDVLVSSSCHSYGWRNGHAALVVDGEFGTTLESITLGMDSITQSSGDEWFREAPNFILLRLKDKSKEERAQIAKDALDSLLGIPYSLFVGFFSPKDQFSEEKDNSERGTHCSHLVWQAFQNAGLDIDGNGGRLVTARDIARSPLFEVVQVYGFDPEKLW